MTYDEYGDAEYDFVEASLKDRSEEAVQVYLGRFGDAIDERVMSILKTSEELLESGFIEQALTASCTSIEIMIRFMVVRPLVQGAFLSEEWSEILTDRIGSGRADADRKLFPRLLQEWGIDINDFQINNNELLWDYIHKEMIPTRNKVVHAGMTITEDQSEKAVSAAKVFRNTVIKAIEKRFGFTLETTGCWCRSSYEEGSVSDGTYKKGSAYFVAESPFE